jgi:hypothetical protein
VKSSINIIITTINNIIGFTSCGIFLGPLLLKFVVSFFSSRKKLENPNLRRDLFLLLLQLGNIYY